MFALSLSHKILTACLIQGVDKKRMKSTESHLRSNVRWKRLRALRRVLVSNFILCASKVCIPRVFYYYRFFSSILPKFSVYIYFSEDSYSVLLRDSVSIYQSLKSDLFPSRRREAVQCGIHSLTLKYI